MYYYTKRNKSQVIIFERRYITSFLALSGVSFIVIIAIYIYMLWVQDAEFACEFVQKNETGNPQTMLLSVHTYFHCFIWRQYYGTAYFVRF
jgi:hypothetical protein